MNSNNNKGLYVPSMEHDSCGIGFVANLKGKKSHENVQDAITMPMNMEHRGGCGCEPETGDGAGILIQNPHEFLKEECSKLGFELPEFGSYGEMNKGYTGDDVKGFSKMLSNQVMIYNKVKESNEQS